MQELENDFCFYQGPDMTLAKSICQENNINFVANDILVDESLQFALFDTRNQFSTKTTTKEYCKIRSKIIEDALKIFDKLIHRRFLCIIIPNVKNGASYLPFAWDLAIQLSSHYSLKDEKIACKPDFHNPSNSNYFTPTNELFYCLYFRKDENSASKIEIKENRLFGNNVQLDSKAKRENKIPAWFILKPQPRKKNEVLHPAKYPEDLVELFVEQFTKENDNVFDPMSGTGSTQVAAIKAGRNGYGTELSDFFAEIAINRCFETISPTQKELFSEPLNQHFLILNKDAREIKKEDFPTIDYLITSPPYWDMLNMKGAENQAKRIEKGLQTNYSDTTDDLGNIADYHDFINDLTNIYFNIIDLMKSGSYLTIVVKNIKKKGKNYPFAWDLSEKLMEKLILLPETFWCQDDINLAPYGYGNTFVSNTFHQYCLNFQKP